MIEAGQAVPFEMASAGVQLLRAVVLMRGRQRRNMREPGHRAELVDDEAPNACPRRFGKLLESSFFSKLHDSGSSRSGQGGEAAEVREQAVTVRRRSLRRKRRVTGKREPGSERDGHEMFLGRRGGGVGGPRRFACTPDATQHFRQNAKSGGKG